MTKKASGLDYFKKLLLFFALITVLLVGLRKFFPEIVTQHLTLLQGYFFAVLFIGFRINHYGLKNARKNYYTFFVLSMTIRFLTALVLNFVILTRYPEKKVVFVLNFFILYLLYTWFENYFLLRNLRADLNNGDAKN